MPAPIIKIDGITKSFGSFKVLDGLSLEVRPAEKLALIGPSGSGKTTILRILMTLERIDGGHIQVDGEHLGGGVAYRHVHGNDTQALGDGAGSGLTLALVALGQ